MPLRRAGGPEADAGPVEVTVIDMPPVVVVGPASWNLLVDLDVLPDPVPHTTAARSHRDGLGGTSAAKALNLARLGTQTRLHTVLGTDAHAGRILGAVKHPALTVHATSVDGPSERHLNLMSADGGRLSIHLDSPRPPTRDAQGWQRAFDGAGIAIIDLADWARPALAAARAAGCEVWCDLHDYDGSAAFHRDFLEAADVLFISDDRLPDPVPFLRDCVAAGCRLAVCTRGARGALALTRDEGWLSVTPPPVSTVVDTNGAGDAFVAALLSAQLGGLPLADSLRRAAAAGAICVQSTELAAPALSPGAVAALAESSRVESGLPQSGTAQSGTAQSGTAQSGTAQSGTAQPGTAPPGTGRPDTTQPGTGGTGRPRG